MLNAVQIVITLFIYAVIGYIFSKKKLLDDNGAKFIQKLIVNVGVPCSAVYNVAAKYTKDSLLESFPYVGVAACIIVAAFVIAMIVGKLIKIQNGRIGVFSAMVSCANTLFIGLPVCQAVFPDTFAYCFMFDMAVSIFFWSVLVYFIAKDANKDQKFTLSTLKRVLSPGLFGTLAGIVLVLLQIELPMFADKTFSIGGGLCTPLALIYVGYIIEKNGFKSIKLSKDLIAAVVGRVLFTPLLCLGVCMLLGVPSEVAKVFTVIAAMPVMNNCPIVAGQYGADSLYATSALTVSIIVSLCMLPLWMLLLGVIF